MRASTASGSSTLPFSCRRASELRIAAEPALERGLVDVDEPDVHAGGRCDLGDPGAHLTRTDDQDPVAHAARTSSTIASP